MLIHNMAPLFRSVLNDDFSPVHRPWQESSLSAVPFDIEATDNDHYQIVLQVPGFSMDMLNVEVQQHVLTVSGKLVAEPVEGEEEHARHFLHHGIQRRSFERRFQLDEHDEVSQAYLNDGLLVLAIHRRVPEHVKAKTITINRLVTPVEKPTQLEQKAA